MTDPLERSPYLDRPLREWPEMGDVAVRMARETNRLLREQASGIVPEHVTRARAFVAEGLAMAHASADWHGSLSISHRSADQPDRDGYFTIAVGEKDLTPHAIEKLAAKLAATTEDSMHFPKPEGDFELAPEGSHVGYCYRVIDLGTQERTWKGQPADPKRMVLVQWELAGVAMSDGRPFIVSQRYTFSGHPKARLRKDLESWRGKAFKDEDFGPGGFQIQSILGHPVYLGLIHHTAENGNTYVNITAVMKMPGQPTAPYQLTNEPLHLSLEPGEFDSVVFGKLSEGLQGAIARSPEYQHLGRQNPTAQAPAAGFGQPAQAAPPASFGNGAAQGPLPDPGATPPAGLQPAGTAAMTPANVAPDAPPPASADDYGASGWPDDDEIPFAPCRI